MTLKRTPLAKISPKLIDKLATKLKANNTTLAKEVCNTYRELAIPSHYGLKRTGTLKKSPLRRQTPKQAKRSRKLTTMTQDAIEKAGGRCPKCHKQFTVLNPASLDHKVQRGKGGKDNLENLRLLCAKCHDRRHNGTAREQHPENF